MSQCPNCSTILELSEQNFGTLFNCPKCASVFFIGWDGIPEVQSLIPLEELSQNPAESAYQDDSSEDSDAPVSPLEVEYSSEEAVEVSENPSLDESELLESVDNNFLSSELDRTLDSPLDTPLDSPSDFIAEIESFANSTNASSSALTYDLVIGGIDSAEVLKQVREALLDSKFGWDVNEIMRTLRGGILEIPELNPIKAVVLLSRLKAFKVDLSWRQNVQ